MIGNFGFSYVGLIYMLLLVVPNIIWAKNKPKGYDPSNENKILLAFERIGQILCTASALCFSDYNPCIFDTWTIWLFISTSLMLLYEINWIRYFRSSRTVYDFYRSFFAIPVPGATLPVVAFFLLGVYGQVIWLIISSIILGIGHIGIHLQHLKLMKMKVNKSTIPIGSLIENYMPADYSDVYSCVTNAPNEIIPDDVMINLWTDFPGWINALFRFRDFLAKFIGLKGAEGNNRQEFEKCIRMGGTYEFVTVPAKSDNETVLLLSDKHLDAYISVHLENGEKHQTISIITLVMFKNKLGRFYFFIIRPFHGFIGKSLLKRSVISVLEGK